MRTGTETHGFDPARLFFHCKFIDVRPTRIGGDLPGTDFPSVVRYLGEMVNCILRRKLIKALSGYSENLKMHEKARGMPCFRCTHKSLREDQFFELGR